ncbi:MAG TPA: NADH-quinone oxidoreductase subunit F, partial [Candidatus Ozemobacteraceae bacterium]|nr:NADH-quinone oxidoreductase subunit F [Candidatus Ozemobacteraceae bacterium]
MNTPSINLVAISEQYRGVTASLDQRVIVCAGTGCVANGALRVQAALEKAIREAGLPVVTQLKVEEKPKGTFVSHSGCQGFCQMGPLVTILPANILYCKVKADDVAEIVRETLQQGNVIERLLYHDPGTGKHCRGAEEITFYKRQTRTVLRECGLIDPDDIREYISHGGYEGARKAYTELKPEAICEEV